MPRRSRANRIVLLAAPQVCEVCGARYQRGAPWHAPRECCLRCALAARVVQPTDTIAERSPRRDPATAAAADRAADAAAAPLDP